MSAYLSLSLLPILEQSRFKVIVSRLVKTGIKGRSGTTCNRPGNPKERRIQNMRLKLILPVVDPEQFEEPTHCSDPQCSGKRFLPWQEVKKNLRDSEYEEVTARRYKCLRCGRTFRVYPQGVQSGQISQRVKGMGVMLYLLGLSYGAAALMLEALAVGVRKSSGYRAVQATAEKGAGIKRRGVMKGYT